jgi:hypothetical protein
VVSNHLAISSHAFEDFAAFAADFADVGSAVATSVDLDFVGVAAY